MNWGQNGQKIRAQRDILFKRTTDDIWVPNEEEEMEEPKSLGDRRQEYTVDVDPNI